MNFNREIKFKALGHPDKSSKNRWIYGTNIYANENTDMDIHSLAAYERLMRGNHLNAKTRCQFTNCFSKNGDELYEGDIILWNGIVNYIKLVKGAYSLVNNKSNNYRYLFVVANNCEIIGNIHIENKYYKVTDSGEVIFGIGY